MKTKAEKNSNNKAFKICVYFFKISISTEYKSVKMVHFDAVVAKRSALKVEFFLSYW